MKPFTKFAPTLSWFSKGGRINATTTTSAAAAALCNNNNFFTHKNQCFSSQSNVVDLKSTPLYTSETGTLDDCETVVVGFTDIYGRFLGKRFDKNFFKKSVAKSGTHGCNYLLTCDMDMTPQDGFTYSNWEGGYGDFHLVCDLNTWRKASWLNNTGIVICDVYDPISHELVDVAPRSMLHKQIIKANKMGYYPLAASELEYYIYEKNYRTLRKENYSHETMNPIGYYLEDYHILQGTRSEWINAQFRRHLSDSGIPVECTKGEAGIGQHELNIEYSDVLTMSDRHVFYKQCLKEVAELNDVSVTFMSKPFTDSTGSGCHIHLSLHDASMIDQIGKGETNVFVGNENVGNKLKNCSKLFKYFLAGWIEYTPQMFPFFAPTVNSYKRFVTASWAPTKLEWSFDNRTAGFRIVGDAKSQSLRIEMRICGADVNPYLVFAGSLAAGLSGIENELALQKPFEGNIYSDDDKHSSKEIDQNAKVIPSSFEKAISQFRDSKWANDTFGENVVQHYALFYDLERKAHQKAVSDWERKRYFEQI